MIISFKDNKTQIVFVGIFVKDLPTNIQRIALRKLIWIDNASDINDLRVPPGNRLEKLTGDYAGKWSIRINDQWRICFVPSDDWTTYSEVEIVDYH